ncbi:hypothetical protein KQH56_00295 [bacterium]|nr:hypothetical protein [bacterium]
MSYPQRRTLVNIITMALVYGAYCLTAFSRHAITDPLRPWAVTMLTFIGIAAIAAIIIQIVFHVAFSIGVSVREAVKNRHQEEEVIGEEIEDAIKGELIEDERDKLLEWKSARAGSVALGAGLMLGLVSILLNFPTAVMVNLVYGAFFIGTIAEGIVNLILYRRDAAHG